MTIREQYGNSFSTTIAAPVAATDTTITVADASGFPSVPQFTLRVSYEYMIVTGISGNVLTVTRGVEGCPAVAHGVGEIVFIALTKGSLSRLCRQSLNGTNVAARREINFTGSNVTLTDDPTNDKVDIAITSGGGGGSNGYPVADTPPPTTGWTGINIAGNSAITTAATYAAVSDSNGLGLGENLRCLVSALPAAPYTISARLLGNLQFPSYARFGLCLRESATGKVRTFNWCNENGAYTSSLDLSSWTNPTTFSAHIAQRTGCPIQPYLRIKDPNDGTLSFQVSGDGLTFWTMFTDTPATFFTTGPDQVGIFCESPAVGVASSCTLMSWF